MSRRRPRSRTSTRRCGSPTSPTRASWRTSKRRRGDDQGCQARGARAAYSGSEAEDVGVMAKPSKLTPMGREARLASRSRRRSTTGCPIPERVLERGAPDKGPDKKDHEAIARTLLEALGHFGVEARIVGHGHRPAREPLRAQARARDQGLEDHPAEGRPRLCARLDRHPDPGADSRQAGRRRRGPEPAPPPGTPRRHLRRTPAGILTARCLARQGHLRAAPSGPTCRRCRTR